MPLDELERAIRGAISREIQEGLPVLDGVEGRVARRLAHPPVRRSIRNRVAGVLPSVQIRPRWAFVAGFALLALGIVVGRLSLPISRGLPASATNLFTVAAPGARDVAVVGDFSAWQPISLFDHDRDGVWSVTVALPPGRYEYAFVVDGRWVGQDPVAAEYVRTFGEYVSVRYIGGEGL